MNYYFSVNRYDKSEKISQQIYPLAKDTTAKEVNISKYTRTAKENFSEIHAVFSVKEKELKQSGISLIFEDNNWSINNYVFAPSALYNGNRFYSVEREYAPMYKDDEREILKNQPVITDVPRLELSGNGSAQLNTGDLATPCVGYFCEKDKKGFLLFWKQQNELGNFGITVEEDAKNNNAKFILSAPCVREKYKYGMCTTKVKSDDRGVDLKRDDRITFDVEEHIFDCESKAEFLERFFDLRIREFAPRSLPDKVPFSHAFNLLEKKYNSNNWVESDSFYKSSEAKAGTNRQWQTGWVGGAMNTLPGLIIGNEETVEKCRETLDFIFGPLQHKSGFLYGIYCDSRPYGDTDVDNENIVMSRKNADAMYYLAKQMMYLRKENKDINPAWENGLKSLADAFVTFYRKNSDFAQFIDIEKCEPYAPSTASATMAPGGLVLCGEYFNNEEYIAVAEETAQEYYENYVLEGFTNGGPGEILACPDSESAFALLESLIALHAYTNEKKWLEYAEVTAALCSSWCVSYDYNYEKDAQFGIRKVATSGAVWANVQNKHAAPGICTLSGASLLRLYRATGNIKYLELCRDIAHNITQYISTDENPLYCSYVWGGDPKTQKLLANNHAKFIFNIAKSSKLGRQLVKPIYNIIFNDVGRMGERVNLSDWEGTANVGEFPGGSCWCEVSTMMTYLEIPAAYIQPDAGFVYAIDHLRCNIDNGKITIENPTDYDATYRLMIENSDECSKPLDELFMTNFKTVIVPAHKSITINAERN